MLCPEFLEGPIGDRHEMRGLIFKASQFQTNPAPAAARAFDHSGQTVGVLGLSGHLDGDAQIFSWPKRSNSPGTCICADGVFEIVRLLPPSEGEFQYRIKSADEPHERVVKESLLRRL